VSRADEAVSTFKEGYSCSQAVLVTFAPELGLERESALKISTTFGGGMGHLGEVCGAVTGAFMVLGLKYGRVRADDLETKEKAYARVVEFASEFRRRHGCLSCRELLGCDLGTPEGLQYAREHGLTQSRCPVFVGDAAEIVEKQIAAGL
jgi:C_GCAxxG_C_C family probable redox protein